jgi:mRNA-degrading endonuclease YafQ of YafQ-DinJ toxin-antitoxin module
MPKIEKIIWGAAFKRSFLKRVVSTTDEALFKRKMLVFLDDPYSPPLLTHKLSGRLEGSWSFSVSYDCRVIFRFLADDEVVLIDIGSHDEVY